MFNSIGIYSTKVQNKQILNISANVKSKSVSSIFASLLMKDLKPYTEDLKDLTLGAKHNMDF